MTETKMIQTDIFAHWLHKLRDRRARTLIQARLDRLAIGHVGKAKPLGGKLYELKVNHGPGYRVYYMQRGGFTIVLLCGGDKSSQDRDIAKARQLAAQWRG
jgi:putative addiction module killer protein